MKKLLRKVVLLPLAGLFLSGVAFAANDTTQNPIRIDTFGSDVTISATKVLIRSITVTAYTTAKTVTFIDADNAKVLVLECPAGSSIAWPPTQPRNSNGMEFTNGLYFDDSGSDLAANDFIFIWKY